MDSPTERKALIDKLWSGQYEDSIGRFTASNGDLINLFGQQVEVEAGAADELSIGRPRRPDRLQSIWPRFEGVLLALFRARSQKVVALETAALSVRFLHYRVSRNVWDTVAFIGNSQNSPRDITGVSNFMAHPSVDVCATQNPTRPQRASVPECTGAGTCQGARLVCAKVASAQSPISRALTTALTASSCPPRSGRREGTREAGTRGSVLIIPPIIRLIW